VPHRGEAILTATGPTRGRSGPLSKGIARTPAGRDESRPVCDAHGVNRLASIV